MVKSNFFFFFKSKKIKLNNYKTYFTLKIFNKVINKAEGVVNIV